MGKETGTPVGIFQQDLNSAEFLRQIIGIKLDLKEDDFFIGGSEVEIEEFLSENPNPRLLIVGAQLPDPPTMLGLLRKLRDNDEYSRIPIIVYSAYPADEYRQRFLDAGANVYIEKVRGNDELIGELEKIINN